MQTKKFNFYSSWLEFDFEDQIQVNLCVMKYRLNTFPAAHEKLRGERIYSLFLDDSDNC